MKMKNDGNTTLNLFDILRNVHDFQNYALPSNAISNPRLSLPMFDKNSSITTSADDQIIEFEVPADLTMLSYLRRKVIEFARKMPFNDDEISDIRIAVGEAGANAIKYGGRQNTYKIHIRMEKHSEFFRIFIQDCGGITNIDDWKPLKNDELSDHGRGIMCMKAVMDEVVFRSENSGICVELTKKLNHSL